MNEVYLYGAGGHAKVIIDVLKSKGLLVKEIFDDNPEIIKCMNIPVVNTEVHSPLIISIGNNKTRKAVVEKLQGVSYTKAISEFSIVSESSTVGLGSVVIQGAVVQASVIIGEHVIINTGATVDHDCVIQDYVHIAPGCNLCGNVEVGEGTFIGAGTTIIPGVKIGKWAVVGAGSVIRNNIPDNVMVAGNPSRIYKNINNE